MPAFTPRVQIAVNDVSAADLSEALPLVRLDLFDLLSSTGKIGFAQVMKKKFMAAGVKAYASDFDTLWVALKKHGVSAPGEARKSGIVHVGNDGVAVCWEWIMREESNM